MNKRRRTSSGRKGLINNKKKKRHGRKGVGPRRRRRQGQQNRRASSQHAHKIAVKNKFRKAMSNLRKLSRKKQSAAIQGASNEFIQDVSKFFSQIRTKPELVPVKHRKVFRRHRLKLRKLISKRTPVSEKRHLLTQKGGFLPLLIPIISAIIGATGVIGGSAAAAAIAKSR